MLSHSLLKSKNEENYCLIFGLNCVESSAAESIFTALSQFLESVNSPLKNSIALATDKWNTTVCAVE